MLTKISVVVFGLGLLAAPAAAETLRDAVPTLAPRAAETRPAPPTRSALDRPTVVALADRPAPKIAPAPAFEAIHFDPGKARVRWSQRAKLDEVAAFLKANPNARLAITGYSDASGSARIRNWIANRRAERVVEYLDERHGIDAARVRTDGEPAPDPTRDAPARRADIRVLRR